MRNFRVLLVSILFFAAAGSHAQKRLTIIGSSTSACYALISNDSCYVSLLEHHYETVNPQDTTVDRLAQVATNCYNGMPTTYVPPRPEATYQPLAGKNISAAVALHPNVIIVNYPTNAYDELSVTEVMYCLRTIRDTANLNGIPCFVTTSQPRTSPASFNTSTIKKKMAEIKDSVLAEFGNFALDFWTGFITSDTSILYNSGDDIHMNGLGHAQMYQRVLAKNIFLATLPANFINFNTLYKNNTGIVNWVTARETGVAYFEIQRSSDGKNFLKIATVAANNTAGSNTYQYTDTQIGTGLSYYKILIVDKDGKQQASPVMRVQAAGSKLMLEKVYAHTATDIAVEIQNNEPRTIELQVLNNLGMLISRTTRAIESGTSTFYINTPVLSNGVYHVRLITAKESMTSSFVKN